MPTAAANAAPKAKVSTKTIRTEITEPVEQPVAASPAPLPEPSEDFWRYIQAMKPEDWKKTHTVSIYRYPLGQTKPQKLGRYVKTYKLDSPLVSEDQIFEEFGGGQYDALLRGPARDGSERVTLIAKHSWEMDGPAKNPWATSAATSAAAPGPSEIASTLQVLLQHLETLKKSPTASDNPALKESIALIQQLTQAMPKPEGVKELVAGLASLKELTGAGDGQSSIVETIKVLKELGVIGGESRKSLATELKEILEIAAMVGGGGGAKVDWATSLVQNLPTILEKATPIADRFAEASRNNARVAEIRAGRAPASLPPSTRPAPALAVPAASTASAAPAAESPGARTVAAPETEPATAAERPAGIVVQPPTLDWVKARAVQLFATGKTGDAIAEWLDQIDEQLGNFLGSMDEEKFSAFVKSDPILGQIATAPRFAEFVAQFVDYFTEEQEPLSAPSTQK